MSTESDIVTPVAKPATQAKPGWWMFVLPIVLMVVGALGIGGTLLYAHQQAVAAPMQGRFPGGVRPSGFPTGAFTPGAMPTNGYTPGDYPTDGRTPRVRPSDFPTGNGQGRGGNGQRPNGGPGGINYPGGNGGYQASMRLNGWEIGVISACGVVFASGAALLVWTLIRRRKAGAAVADRQDLTSSEGTPSGIVASSS